MENASTISERYKELIEYLSQIGNSFAITLKTQTDININIFDAAKNVTIVFHLYQPLDKNSYEGNFLKVSWKISPQEKFSIPHKFMETTDPKIIFNIILFEITDWKLKNIDDMIVNTINKALGSEIITSWLKTKEEQIRMEERNKIYTHLNSEEIKNIIIKEINKTDVSFKLHITDNN